MEARNIDDTLVKAMQGQPAAAPQPVPEPLPEAPEPEAPAPEPEQPEQPAEPEANKVDNYGHEVDKPAPKQPEKAASSPIDEYGNPVEKPRMYSEEEVQRMIRDRIARVKSPEAQQATNQQVKQASQEFQHDPNSDESWEDQLNAFVDRRMDQREKSAAEKAWKAEEDKRQAVFEEKFTSGMGKYQDFHQVVSGKPITDAILMATRSLENPAAFVYAASKMHPQEIDRISRIADPYVQAAEVGRLHERMVKERKMVSSAAKPLETPKGDMPIKQINQPSLEARIAQYAKNKRK